MEMEGGDSCMPLWIYLIPRKCMLMVVTMSWPYSTSPSPLLSSLSMPCQSDITPAPHPNWFVEVCMTPAQLSLRSRCLSVALGGSSSSLSPWDESALGIPTSQSPVFYFVICFCSASSAGFSLFPWPLDVVGTVLRCLLISILVHKEIAPCFMVSNVICKLSSR